jgi:putative DNA primase/helicase
LQRTNQGTQVNDTTSDQVKFLSLLFEGTPSGEYGQVALKVKTSDGAREFFKHWAWDGNVLPTGPWYFNAASTSNPKRRLREMMKSLRAVVLDDVGTKVDKALLKAPPTWKIQTSPGNFQWGYLLDWTPDIEKANRLFAALIEAKLQDPGVNRADRLFRVPGSINDKRTLTAEFPAVLCEWSPHLVYTLDSLASHMGIATPTARTRGRPKKELPDLGFKGSEDPVFNWLVEQGMVRHETGDGFWEIQCPFGHEHSDGRDEAKYKPRGYDGTGWRHVSCFHGHGLDAAVFKRRFFDWVEDKSGLRNDPPAAKSTEEIANILGRAMANIPDPRRAEPVIQRTAEVPEDGVFTVGTLTQALGCIPIDKLPFTDKGEKGYSRLQPVTYSNIEAGLAHLGVQVRLNLLNGKAAYVLPKRIDMARFGVKSALEIDGMIDAALCDVFGRVGMRAKKDVRDCFARLANSLYWHPVKDWIEATKWDGQDRLRAITASVSTETPEVWATYFRRWALQTIEATCGWEYRRESQKGLVLVLAGKQGIGKTRWFGSLMPGFTREGKHLNLGGHASRDSKHEALQAAIVELGELETTFRQADIGALKGFITQTTDEYRLPYANEWLTRPRCTSFCGSVNHYNFLNDPTGNRRFLVVEADRADYAHGVDMQQFWAQIHALWLGGEQWWLTDTENALQIHNNDDFTSEDPVDVDIEAAYEARKDRDQFPIECGLTATAVCKVLGIRTGKLEVNAAATTLRRLLGKHQNLRTRGGPPKGWKWFCETDEVKGFTLTVLTPPTKHA